MSTRSINSKRKNDSKQKSQQLYNSNRPANRQNTPKMILNRVQNLIVATLLVDHRRIDAIADGEGTTCRIANIHSDIIATTTRWYIETFPMRRHAHV